MKSFLKFSSPKTSYTVYRKRTDFKNIMKKSQITTEEICPDRKKAYAFLSLQFEQVSRSCAAHTVWSRREIVVLLFVKVRFSHAQDWGVECSPSLTSLEYVKEQAFLPRLALLSDFPFTTLQSRQSLWCWNQPTVRVFRIAGWHAVGSQAWQFMCYFYIYLILNLQLVWGHLVL